MRDCGCTAGEINMKKNSVVAVEEKKTIPFSDIPQNYICRLRRLRKHRFEAIKIAGGVGGWGLSLLTRERKQKVEKT